MEARATAESRARSSARARSRTRPRVRGVVSRGPPEQTGDDVLREPVDATGERRPSDLGLLGDARACGLGLIRGLGAGSRQRFRLRSLFGPANVRAQIVRTIASGRQLGVVLDPQLV